MIRTFALGILYAAIIPVLLACGKLPDPEQPAPAQQERSEGQESKDEENDNDNSEITETAETTMPQTINISVSGKTLQVKIEDNCATRALVEALREGAISYEAHDYGGFEKVGALGRSLPTCDSRITTQAGDVILYSGNQIVLFYGSNSWSYTRLGRLQYESLAELKSFLNAGSGSITVTLSL